MLVAVSTVLVVQTGCCCCCGGGNNRDFEWEDDWGAIDQEAATLVASVDEHPELSTPGLCCCEMDDALHAFGAETCAVEKAGGEGLMIHRECHKEFATAPGATVGASCSY